MKYETIILNEEGERTATQSVYSHSASSAISAHTWAEQELFGSTLTSDEETTEALVQNGFVTTVTNVPEAKYVITIIVGIPALSDAVKNKGVK